MNETPNTMIYFRDAERICREHDCYLDKHNGNVYVALGNYNTIIKSFGVMLRESDLMDAIERLKAEYQYYTVNGRSL